MVGKRGISEAVGAILVLAVALSGFYLYYVNYVWSALRRNEAIHQDKVIRQFLELKDSIIKLDNGRSTFMKVTMCPQKVSSFLYSPPPPQGGTLETNETLGFISFRSSYFARPNFTLCLQNGGVILIQEENSYFISPPSLFRLLNDPKWPNLDFYTVEYEISGSEKLTSTIDLIIDCTAYVSTSYQDTNEAIYVVRPAPGTFQAWENFFRAEDERLTQELKLAEDVIQVVSNYPENIEFRVRGRRTGSVWDVHWERTIIRLETHLEK